MPSRIRPSRALLTAVAAAAVVAGGGLVCLIATAEFAPDPGVWIAADLGIAVS